MLYEEIEGAREIADCQRKFERLLRSEGGRKEFRRIGFPSGYEDHDVHFVDGSRDVEGFWWSSYPSGDGGTAINLFGRGYPGQNDSLSIDLQFNIPLRRFDRKHGGALVRERTTGAVVLAHRGIVSRGMSRVPMAYLFEEADVTLSEVLCSFGVGKVMLVASFTSKTFLEEIRSFSAEMRRAADAAMTRYRSGQSAGSGREAGLGDYFDEPFGRRTVVGRRASIADCRHGAIVRALREQLRDAGNLKKSQLVDLALLQPTQTILFEVKTTCTLQDLYQGIGQLLLHAVAASSQGLPSVRKVLVLPEAPRPKVASALTNELKISAALYRWRSPEDVSFAGLEELLKGR